MRSIAIIFLLAAVAVSTSCNAQPDKGSQFPELPYSYNALEAFIDATTMEIHYSRHHKAYFNNFVKAVDDNQLQGLPIEVIFSEISKYPATVRNNGGGFYNHTLFWEVMAANGGGEPKGKLRIAIDGTFGSFDEFKKKFESAATGQFGSGWAWLSVGANNEIFISSTANQDNPLMDVVKERGTPILALDVWEHAYYLQYQNKRADYATNFWKVVNWIEVEKRYGKAMK